MDRIYQPGATTSPNGLVADNPIAARGLPGQSADAFMPTGSTRPIESLSIVIPCHNEEGNLVELHRLLLVSLEPLGKPFEVIIIDDGSTDGTWATIAALHQKDPRVLGVRHRRNFGKAEALANGFAVARGDVVATMDGDIQDDPAELPRFLDKLDEGYDLVSGWKQRRQDPLGKTFPSKVFNGTVRAVSGVPLHDFNCGFKAYRREVTASLRLYGELHRFTPVLAAAEGFSVGELPVQHHARKWGRSKYGWSRLVKGFLDLLTVTFLTQYRQRPMHLLGLPGLLALAVGVLIGVALSLEKLIAGTALGQRPLLLLAVLLVMIGAQFFGLGLIGEFLAHGSNAPRTELRPLVRETLGLPRGPREVPVSGASGDTSLPPTD
ncbi:MAG TPA: glycosyltransferase family 2 protein [Thermomicrobiales bacterium]|nr:glycosyltransferase family 2 protein [Thermomicrobiales bacterium]